RQYTRGQIDQVSIRTSSGEIETLPWVYEAELLEATFRSIRSFGITEKLDVGFGLEIDHRRYRMSDGVEASAEAARIFTQYALPVSDRRISPYVSIAAYSTRFHRVLNLETLGIQEAFRYGYGDTSALFVGAEALGSSRDLVGSRVSVGYTLLIRYGLIRAGVSNRVVVANEDRHEAFAALRARIVSPEILIGRIHLDGALGHRYQDYLNVAGFRLGGNNRLRGYLAGEFVGKNIAAFNAELRTK